MKKLIIILSFLSSIFLFLSCADENQNPNQVNYQGRIKYAYVMRERTMLMIGMQKNLVIIPNYTSHRGALEFGKSVISNEFSIIKINVSDFRKMYDINLLNSKFMEIGKKLFIDDIYDKRFNPAIYIENKNKIIKVPGIYVVTESHSRQEKEIILYEIIDREVFEKKLDSIEQENLPSGIKKRILIGERIIAKYY